VKTASGVLLFIIICRGWRPRQPYAANGGTV
jgi:hypothetical protein